MNKFGKLVTITSTTALAIGLAASAAQAGHKGKWESNMLREDGTAVSGEAKIRLNGWTKVEIASTGAGSYTACLFYGTSSGGDIDDVITQIGTTVLSTTEEFKTDRNFGAMDFFHPVVRVYKGEEDDPFGCTSLSTNASGGISRHLEYENGIETTS
jgi:hypothetical protein